VPHNEAKHPHKYIPFINSPLEKKLEKGAVDGISLCHWLAFLSWLFRSFGHLVLLMGDG
jgi:hypothetical protein